MFREFLTLFSKAEVARPSTMEVPLALSVLMVRLARADGDYSDVERSFIDEVLCERLGLPLAEAVAVRSEAERIESDASDIVRFTRAIKEKVRLEDRFEIVETLWGVVLADGTRDMEEDGIMRLAAKLLGLNDRDSALARMKVVRELT